MFCSALQLSNESHDAYFTGSGSSTVDGDQRASLTGKHGRQETRLRVHIGEEGAVSIGRRHHGEVADWQQALDVDQDGTDAECVVELRTCISCWIRLTAILDRFEESKAATLKDDRYHTSVNNSSASNAVTCQLWSVVLYAAYITVIYQ